MRVIRVRRSVRSVQVDNTLSGVVGGASWQADYAVPRSVATIADAKIERLEDLGESESESAFRFIDLARKRHWEHLGRYGVGAVRRTRRVRRTRSHCLNQQFVHRLPPSG